MIVDLVGRVWPMGWRPAEVVRQIERSVTPVKAARTLVATAITAHAAKTNEDLDVHPRWAHQLTVVARSAADVGMSDPGDPSNGWLKRLADEMGADGARLLAIEVARQLASLGPLLVLLPYPGIADIDVAKWSDLVGWRHGDGSEDGRADPLLDKVRALLAKAEATEFAAEAEAFTAKAHDLIVRHAIDEAALRGQDPGCYTAEIGARRIALVEPYAKQHLLLLSQVAVAADARCILESDWAMATIVGPERSLGGIETLHTSLMVQAQAAFNEAARSAPAGSRMRSRGYRSSFLTSFASRVGQRLAEQRNAATADAPGSALPVLAADREAVSDAYAKMFTGSLRSVSFGASDSAGWMAGAAAGDRARLGSHAVGDRDITRALG